MQTIPETTETHQTFVAASTPEASSGIPAVFAAKQTLFRIGDTFSKVYRVKEGLIKTSRINADGIEQIAGFYVAGDVVGFDGFMAGEHRINATAIELSVLESMEVALPRETSHQRDVIAMMAREIHYAQEHLALMNKTRAEARLAAFLISMDMRLQAIHGEGTPWISISRMDMASFLGITNETVSRLLKRFEAEGLLLLKGRKLQVTGRKGLRLRGTI
ncbi:Fumarate and nitrate reduction regulatory protein [BD1-7 clade bacterium]|uniref:Fumarate and nitrate reduction regulatory protein n=1 Tax=BD1-7 clade bacterium TaxID=2029982 RepID=A0A5S9QAX8_9GAMM|nr:Fumarate and nitrate reduction regulatory protein [BD1-7 clade bacterium]